MSQVHAGASAGQRASDTLADLQMIASHVIWFEN